jgi:ADP-ribose pyrophosphatase YjhB (NUDIX family)
MKNVQVLVSTSDVHAYVANLWKTNIFRNSHANGGFIHDVVDQFAKLPRLFCETTNDTLERAHFSTWWGAMMRRDDYTNPVIADLYWLHEMIHAGTMPYVKDIGRAAFDEKMVHNELMASVGSEIQVYFEMPGLRDSSFAHPIYADRFLDSHSLQLLWNNNKAVAIQTLCALRRDVMLDKPEHELDSTERWIRKFAQQNAMYSLVWADIYVGIENHMAEFQLRALSGDRQGAIEFHRDWLLAEAGKDSIDNIPFRRKAELFTPVYWDNKAKLSAEMEAEAQKLRQHMITDPVLQKQVAQRVAARGFDAIPDQPVHTLGTLIMRGDREVSLHIRHAVDVVVTDPFGQIILITREHNPGIGLKALPGGFLLSSEMPANAENLTCAAFRVVARETGIPANILQNAVVTPVGERSYDRPFDIRTSWCDMADTTIKAGEVFTVSTQALHMRLNTNLANVPFKAGRDAASIHVARIGELSRDQFGIGDHLHMIKSVRALQHT